jgi:uncharacterized membrane protein
LKSDLPHRFVFVFGLLFGGSLIGLSPPFSVPDESAHFDRAYHCAEGKLYAIRRDNQTGDELPASLIDAYLAIAGQARHDEDFAITRAKFDQAAQIPLDPARRQFVAFSNTALYSPIAYLPQTAAICLARFWAMGPIRLLYVARIANLVMYLLLASAAVRLAPIHKWTLALAALVPMSVYLAASAHADAMTIGLSLVVLAFVLRLALGYDKPSANELLALAVLMTLVVLAKQAYFGLTMLFFVIPGGKFASPRRRWLAAAAVIGMPLLIEAAWAFSLRGLYVPMLPWVDPPAQFRSILGDPWSYLATLCKAIYKLQNHSQMIGQFGWVGESLPAFFRHTYWIALVVTAVLDGGKPLAFGTRAKAIAFGTYLFTAAGVATMVYLSWERIGIKSIDGIQPRYWLPILPPLLLPLRGGPKLVSSRFSQTAVPIIAITAVLLATAATWWTLWMRYYW